MRWKLVVLCPPHPGCAGKSATAAPAGSGGGAQLPRLWALGILCAWAGMGLGFIIVLQNSQVADFYANYGSWDMAFCHVSLYRLNNVSFVQRE